MSCILHIWLGGLNEEEKSQVGGEKQTSSKVTQERDRSWRRRPVRESRRWEGEGENP